MIDSNKAIAELGEEEQVASGRDIAEPRMGNGTGTTTAGEALDARRTSDNRRLTLTVEEVASRLGIGRSLAYDAVRRGDIPSIRVGRRYLIPAFRLHEFLSGDQSA